LTDFYTAEELSDAKFQLYNDIDKLKLALKWPHVAQRRDTDTQAWINKVVDDVILLVTGTFADENKLGKITCRDMFHSVQTECQVCICIMAI